MFEFDKIIMKADEEYNKQNYYNAAELYKKALNINPNDIAALIDYGNALDALGQKDEAAASYKKALEIKPKSATAFTNLSGTLYELGKFEDALNAAEEALKVKPNSTAAIINKANCLDALGKKDEAIKYYERVIELDPNYALPYANLGNTYYEKNMYERAIFYSLKSVELDDSDINAFINLGNAYDAINENEKSLENYHKALLIDPDNVTALNNIATIYEKLEDFNNALKFYWKAISLERDYMDGHINFGFLLYDIYSKGMKDIANEWAAKWKNEFSDNSIAQHMASAVKVGDVPERASDEYIINLFDSFAPDFNESLAAIDYKAPELVGNKVAQIYNSSIHTLTTLDAGCGTGLCAPYVRKFSRKLIGVDLSEGMINEAKKHQVYDELIKAEITEYLNSNKDKFDLIISADVLTYFGVLENVFNGFAIALKNGGRIIVTVTKCSEENAHKRYNLHESGRYNHSEEYVLETLADSNLTLISIEDVYLRKENGNSVLGMLIVAQK